MNTKPKTVLVVDDDPKILKAVLLRLTAAGYLSLSARNGVDALAIARADHPDLIITDIWMPIGVGFSLAHRLKELALGIPVIFLTASKQMNLKELAQQAGVVGFLEKPYSPEALLTVVAQALGAREPVGAAGKVAA